MTEHDLEKQPKYHQGETDKVFYGKEDKLSLQAGGIKRIGIEIRRRKVKVSFSNNHNTYEEEAVVDEPTSIKDEAWDNFVADFVKEVREKASAATRKL